MNIKNRRKLMYKINKKNKEKFLNDTINDDSAINNECKCCVDIFKAFKNIFVIITSPVGVRFVILFNSIFSGIITVYGNNRKQRNIKINSDFNDENYDYNLFEDIISVDNAQDGYYVMLYGQTIFIILISIVFLGRFISQLTYLYETGKTTYYGRNNPRIYENTKDILFDKDGNRIISEHHSKSNPNVNRNIGTLNESNIDLFYGSNLDSLHASNTDMKRENNNINPDNVGHGTKNSEYVDMHKMLKKLTIDSTENNNNKTRENSHTSNSFDESVLNQTSLSKKGEELLPSTTKLDTGKSTSVISSENISTDDETHDTSYVHREHEEKMFAKVKSQPIILPTKSLYIDDRSKSKRSNTKSTNKYSKPMSYVEYAWFRIPYDKYFRLTRYVN